MTDQEIQQTILRELRMLRGSLETHKADTSRHLASLEEKMDRVLNPEPILVPASTRRSTRRPS
jgi:hypothetical protein